MLADALRQAAPGDPLRRAARVDREVALTESRPLVGRVGLPRTIWTA